MTSAPSTLWLQPAPASAGCGGCLTSQEGPRCRAHVTGQACVQPRLAGPLDTINRVLKALDREAIDPDSGRGIVSLHWVRSLRIEHGEAELTLSFEPSCGPGKTLSESAFQTLRQQLPDTDIYIRHQA